MTDYQPLIARAVEGLDKSTGEARRALYERARSALVTQLRAVEPPLSESDITKERLALEDAIRKVEAEAARKARMELRETRPAPPPRREAIRAESKHDEPRHDEPRHDEPRHDEPRYDERGQQEPVAPQEDLGGGAGVTAAPPAPPTARERLLGARSPAREGIRGLRDAVSGVQGLGKATSKAAQSARDLRDSYGPSHPGAAEMPADERPKVLHNDVEQNFDAGDLRSAEHVARRPYGRQASYDLDEQATAGQPARHPPHAAEEDYRQPRPPRSYRGLVQLLVGLIIVAGLAATISWQWPRITALYHSIVQIGSRPQTSPQTHEAPAQPKFSGRVPQEQGSAPAPSTSPGSQTTPAVAQRVVLYEEDSNDPAGKRYVGSVIWRTETVSPGPGLAPELAVRADVEIPERHLTMTWSLRRNTDQALPASHTIEIQFSVPADFAGGGIANVPGILMKQSEQARGTPLAGLAVKVTSGFFLIGLSAVDTEVQRNIQLLKERPWFDIPVVYANGGRAILAMEKGPPGDRAFADAFATWEKK